MPIYEYKCDECNHVLDALQKVSDKPLADCPECGKSSLRRLISAPNFRLKGEGWYETDFKKENRKNVADKKDGNLLTSGMVTTLGDWKPNPLEDNDEYYELDIDD